MSSMSKILKIGVFGLFLLLLSCDKNENKPVEDGIYVGTFTVKYYFVFVDMPASWGGGSGTTTLELKNGKYTCTGNPDKIPAGGSGDYSTQKNKIIFSDVNGWYADFDWNRILNGEYDYTFDGKKLKISANKSDIGHYEYDLEKQ